MMVLWRKKGILLVAADEEHMIASIITIFIVVL